MSGVSSPFPHGQVVDSLITTDLVRRLVAEQFPQYAHLPVRRVAHDGWDNRTFRLGEELTVRLPSAEGYVGQVTKEHRWLPQLADQLPLPIPAPVGLGEPAQGFPFPWSIYRWIVGDVASIVPIPDRVGFAADVAAFLTALQAADATGGPGFGLASAWRGGPLTTYADEAVTALRVLRDEVDLDAAMTVWDAAVATRWEHAPVWVHGDVALGNLLVRDGRLVAVIDFGCCETGDPACDTVIAWTELDGDARQEFRDGLDLDDATWARGRGWALWKAAIVLVGARSEGSPAGDVQPSRDHRGAGRPSRARMNGNAHSTRSSGTLGPIRAVECVVTFIGSARA